MANSTSIHGVRWQEVCPWLLLIRAIRVSLFAGVLALALGGVLLTQAGWHAAQLGMSAPTQWSWSPVDEPQASWRFQKRSQQPNSQHELIRAENESAILESATTFAVDHPLIRGWAWSMQPLCRWRETSGGRDRACLVAAQAWALAVWGIVGVAIARIAVLRMVRDESVAPGEAIAYALRRWTTAVSGPCITIAGIVTVALPLVVAGLLLRADWSAGPLATVWGVALLIGLVLVAGCVGLLAGWPLMFAAAAVDSRDAFDGISRAYGYVFQRPLHLVWYLLVVAFFGFLAGWLLETAVDATVAFTEGVVRLGAGAQRAAELFEAESRDGGWAVAAIRGWRRLLEIAVGSYALALLWSAVTAIYLLLRQQVDDTELDVVAN